MPRVPDFDALTSFRSLLAAYGRARRAGRTRPATREFDLDLESNLMQLSAELRDGTWRPGPYRSFYVTEPKRRLVSAAPFRDRVVHHALVSAVEPLFERRFVFDSYANRRGKGTHAAVLRAHRFARSRRYCLRADVVKFFPSIDHEVVLATFARTVTCSRTPTPALVKIHDLLLWLLPTTAKFPKTLRHSLTNRIECAALDLEAALLRANRMRGERRLAALDDADALLDALRMFLRLAVGLNCLSGRQHEFVAGKTTEIGRLIGGWRKATAQR